MWRSFPHWTEICFTLYSIQFRFRTTRLLVAVAASQISLAHAKMLVCSLLDVVNSYHQFICRLLDLSVSTTVCMLSTACVSCWKSQSEFSSECNIANMLRLGSLKTSAHTRTAQLSIANFHSHSFFFLCVCLKYTRKYFLISQQAPYDKHNLSSHDCIPRTKLQLSSPRLSRAIKVCWESPIRHDELLENDCRARVCICFKNEPKINFLNLLHSVDEMENILLIAHSTRTFTMVSFR